MFSPMRKPARKTVAGDEHPDRPDRPRGFQPGGRPDPRHARDHVEKRWIGERHAREDVAAVEEPERRREREQRDQVEVPERERPAQVGEPDQEDQAEAEPDDRLVDVAAAEGTRPAARHLPRHLRAGPGFGRRAPSGRRPCRRRSGPPHPTTPSRATPNRRRRTRPGRCAPSSGSGRASPGPSGVRGRCARRAARSAAPARARG